MPIPLLPSASNLGDCLSSQHFSDKIKIILKFVFFLCCLICLFVLVLFHLYTNKPKYLNFPVPIQFFYPALLSLPLQYSI